MTDWMGIGSPHERELQYYRRECNDLGARLLRLQEEQSQAFLEARRSRTVVRLGSSTEYAASSSPLTEQAALEPRGFFGATKAAGSLLLQAAAAERGVRAVVLRAFQVYGPGDHPTRLVPVVLEAARTGSTVPRAWGVSSITGPPPRRPPSRRGRASRPPRSPPRSR